MRTKHGPEISAKLIEKHQYKEQTGEVAGPRNVNRFTPSISAKHILNVAGRREGSDWSHVQSHYGRATV